MEIFEKTFFERLYQFNFLHFPNHKISTSATLILEAVSEKKTMMFERYIYNRMIFYIRYTEHKINGNI